jgi:hypothetical protein
MLGPIAIHYDPFTFFQGPARTARFQDHGVTAKLIMPTCIDARVRKLGLKKTSATDLPASGSELFRALLSVAAESTNDDSSAEFQSDVFRKCLVIDANGLCGV